MNTKKITHFIKLAFLGLLITTLFFNCSATKKFPKLKPEEIRGMINSPRFIFVAERVNPLRTSTRFLTSRYDVTLNKDTLISFLPYFGRAFNAPINSAKGPLDFKSHQFSYTVNKENEDEWQIYIQPKDVAGVQQLIFEIFGNGVATLNVQNTHRDPISFFGHIEKIKDH